MPRVHTIEGAGLGGATFTIPAPANDPTGDAVIAAFPAVTERKIPMRCEFRPEVNAWECDVPRWFERREVWFGVGGAAVAFFAGAWVGKRRSRR